MLTDLTIVETRCDWLTVSAKHNPELGAIMGIAAQGLLREQQTGARLKTWHAAGWETARAGHWLLATGRHGAYVSVGGEDAQTWGDALLSSSDKCTRVDYAVTLQLPDALETPLPAALAHLRTRYEHDRLADSIRHYRGLKADRGITIGDRTSPYHARIYDKTMESQGVYPRGCWRWEVELKEHAAAFEFQAYRQDPKRFHNAGGIVKTHMGRWGLTVPADVGPNVVMAIQHRKPSDAEKALRWLERQVRPTVMWLIEIGRGADAHRVLFEQLAIPEEE